MHVGTQQFNTSDEDLEYLARHGVFNKNENFITFHREYGWDVAELKQKKEKCARFGIDMEMVAIPIARLNASGGEVPDYMLGNREEGDREIEPSTDPCNEVPEIIRYFGSRNKIFLCHFRNIVGGRNKFQEVWPDEGVMNMHRNMQALKEVGYRHMCVPDHAPGHKEPGATIHPLRMGTW